MAEIRRALEDAVAGFRPAPDALDRTLQRFRRRERGRRLLAAGAALALSFAVVSGLWAGLGGLVRSGASAAERRQLETRLEVLERAIREQEALERRLRGKLSAAREVTRELQRLLENLREQRSQAPLPAERREILERIKQAQATLEQRLAEAAALKARLEEVTAQLSRALGQREVLRQWLASLGEPP